MLHALKAHFWLIPAISLLASLSLIARGVVFLQSEPSFQAPVEQLLPNEKPAETVEDKLAGMLSGEETKTILDRNIFDSVTGSVLHSPLPSAMDAPREPERLDLKDLIRCPGSGEVVVEATVSDEGNAGDSFAAVNQDGNRLQLFIGDEVLNRKVIAITWRYIILQGTEDVCYLDLF